MLELKREKKEKKKDGRSERGLDEKKYYHTLRTMSINYIKTVLLDPG